MLSSYLTLAAILFCIGLYGALTKRNAVIVLLSIELMLNAVNLNLVAFSKYGVVPSLTGQMFSLFNIAVAAAEAAVGIAILIALYRARGTVNVDDYDAIGGKSAWNDFFADRLAHPLSSVRRVSCCCWLSAAPRERSASHSVRSARSRVWCCPFSC